MMNAPHEFCYVRLRPSEHGVGVFAICDIPKGTNIFESDGNYETVKVSADWVETLPANIRKMYYDFCPLESGEYECPINFNMLTPAWYLNNSENNNCSMDENLDICSIRDIAEGEEITVLYSDYSEIPPGECV